MVVVRKDHDLVDAVQPWDEAVDQVACVILDPKSVEHANRVECRHEDSSAREVRDRELEFDDVADGVGFGWNLCREANIAFVGDELRMGLGPLEAQRRRIVSCRDEGIGPRE